MRKTQDLERRPFARARELGRKMEPETPDSAQAQAHRFGGGKAQ